MKAKVISIDKKQQKCFFFEKPDNQKPKQNVASNYQYFFVKISGTGDFFSLFLQTITSLSSLNVSETLYQHRINQYMGLNQQLYDLGLPLVDLYKLDAIKVR